MFRSWSIWHVGFLLAELGSGLLLLVSAQLVGLLFLPIGRRSFASVCFLRTAECRCSCASHRQYALLALLPLKVEHKQLYRQDAEWPSDIGAGDSPSVQPEIELLLHRLGSDP